MKAIKVAKKLITKGLDDEFISDATELSTDDVHNLRDEWKNSINLYFKSLFFILIAPLNVVIVRFASPLPSVAVNF